MPIQQVIILGSGTANDGAREAPRGAGRGRQARTPLKKQREPYTSLCIRLLLFALSNDVIVIFHAAGHRQTVGAACGACVGNRKQGEET